MSEGLIGAIAAAVIAVVIWVYQTRLSAQAREYESKLRDQELKVREDHLKWREEALDSLNERSRDLERKEAEIRQAEERIALSEEQQNQRLQALSELTPEAARHLVLEHAQAEATQESARLAAKVEQEALVDADRRVKNMLIGVMERNASEYLTEATTAVIPLPSEEMKGRIIGREGRNIRTFEQVTGVDLIIDDTPEAVVISSFDPVRRETARIALMNLMLDGRIHPGKIEELFEAAQEELERVINEAGIRAAERAQVYGLNPAILRAMGQLRFRTSYAQNVLDHSVEVAFLAGQLAAELGAEVDVARTAGFLHDIGKGLGEDFPGPHALSGMEFLRQQGVPEAICHAVGAHHYEIPPESPEATLVIIADSLSAARPGARRESLDSYLKRVTSLEAIANDTLGVDRSYVVQAGREIRVFVKPDMVSDDQAQRLAKQIARKIEANVDYPGQIKITMIRESRFQEIAT